jgi:probable HAF family extracellular repeat protein
VVVGTGTSATNQAACFRWQDGVAVDLGSLGGSCWVHAINDKGQIAGESDSPRFYKRAIIIDQDGMHDLGLLPGGYFSQALGINEKGHAAVYANGTQGGHAALWNGRRLVDLGSLDDRYSHSIASAINDHDELAGLSTCGDGFQNCLFLYSDGQMTPVQPLIDNADGWVWGPDDWPVGITNDGVIIGNATGPDFTVHAYRLVPNAQ